MPQGRSARSGGNSKKVLNIGGEGEIPGAINMNNLSQLTKSTDAIKKSGPLVQADMFKAFPFKTGSMDKVVSKRLGDLGLGGAKGGAQNFIDELNRVLKPGGSFELHFSSGVSKHVLGAFKNSGLKNVKVNDAGRLIGTR